MADIEVGAPKSHQISSTDSKLYLFSQTILRTLVISTTLASTWIVVAAKQSAEIFGITLEARYTYSPAFKFFAFANAIACGFSLLSVILLYIPSRPLQKHANHILFLHDLLLMSLVLGGCASGSAIGYVGKYGNSRASWLPICDEFGKFCHRLTIAIVLSYMALLCLLLLTISSATLRPTKLAL